tara:strand:- start:5126 stop:5518 length:393 start_codon:yes stop_codon:yes gene_type:complete
MPLEGFDDAEIPRRGPGRPAQEIDLDAVERAASIGCIKEEIAAVIGVAPSTLYLRMTKEPEIAAAIERGQSKGRATLRRLQWQGANEGNATMLIWLGKQMLGQRDKQEHAGPDGGAIVHRIERVIVDPKD